MTTDLETVGAMHKCKKGEAFSTCVHCGAIAEGLSKPCPKFMRQAGQAFDAIATPAPAQPGQEGLAETTDEDLMVIAVVGLNSARFRLAKGDCAGALEVVNKAREACIVAGERASARAARAAPQPATADARPFPAMVDGLLWLCTRDGSGTIRPLDDAAALPIPLSWKAAMLESWAAQRGVKP